MINCQNRQDKILNLPRYSNNLFTDIKYYSPSLSEQYVVGVYSSEGSKYVTMYGEDFCKLQNNCWLNGTMIDTLLLTYVNNEIGYIPVKISNTIWSSTKIEIAKFDWTKYCVLFLPINPEGIGLYLLWTSFWVVYFTWILCVQNQVTCTHLN